MSPEPANAADDTCKTSRQPKHYHPRRSPNVSRHLAEAGPYRTGIRCDEALSDLDCFATPRPMTASACANRSGAHELPDTTHELHPHGRKQPARGITPELSRAAKRLRLERIVMPQLARMVGKEPTAATAKPFGPQPTTCRAPDCQGACNHKI